MNLLFYRYGSICEPDIIEGFQELGLTVYELSAEITNKAISQKDVIRLLDSYLTEQPVDFVFSINFYPTVSEVCNIYHIPYLCWIVDSPVMELYTKSIQNKWNRVFLFDRAIYDEIHPLNPECVYHLPLATNVRQKSSVIQAATCADNNKYSARLSFVGSMYTEKCAFDRFNAPKNSYLRGYINGIIAAQLKVYGYFFVEEMLNDSIVNEFIEHFPYFYHLPGESFLTDKKTLAQLYIGTKITVEERAETMKLLSENFPTAIYTGSDTSAYPKLENRGLARTLTEMPLVFKNSVINLNTTAKSIRSGLSLRIWDILGSEGFCLTNYQTELPEFLVPGEHLDMYSSLDELRDKVRYYLEHPKLCRDIAVSGADFVAKYHTYPIRLTRMLELAYKL